MMFRHPFTSAFSNFPFNALCLLYGCRNGELRVSKKSHFDFTKKIWTIPIENHKTGNVTKKPLLRPIIPEIEPLLKDAFHLSKSEYVFNNRDTNEPMGLSSPLALPYNIIKISVKPRPSRSGM